MVDDGSPALRVVIDPRAKLDAECVVHNTPATGNSKGRRAVCSCWTRHLAVYEDVRRLAGSDPVVAAELGAAIWRDAVLEVEEFAALLRFVKERPAAMRLVRGLVLTLDCAGTDMDTKTGGGDAGGGA
jgi:hypothetical protein